MSNEATVKPRRGIMFWAGWAISILVTAALTMSAVVKVMQPVPEEALKGMQALGLPEKLLPGIALTEALCTVIYLIPQTAVLGAILLTGYLGGATSMHVRVSDQFAGPVIIGVLVWLGLFLRDPRVRALIPWRRVG